MKGAAQRQEIGRRALVVQERDGLIDLVQASGPVAFAQAFAAANRLEHASVVLLDQFRHAPVLDDAAAVQEQDAGAERLDRGHAVADEQHRAAGPAHLAHPAHALALEGHVTHHQHLELSDCLQIADDFLGRMLGAELLEKSFCFRREDVHEPVDERRGAESFFVG